jgi:CheY-like chemotaxis protein
MLVEEIEYSILLADDDGDDCYFFKKALAALPIKTRLQIVSNGMELMDLLTTRDVEMPYMLFMDLKMPYKNGAQCLLEIKNIERLATMPVIIYSTLLEEETINRFYLKGAHYYIHKPASFSCLKNVISKAFDLVKRNQVQQCNIEEFLITK